MACCGKKFAAPFTSLEQQTPPYRVTLRVNYSFGDTLVMSAAVKALAERGYKVSVLGTGAAEIFQHNPDVVPVDRKQSNYLYQMPLMFGDMAKPHHFTQAFVDTLAKRFNLELANPGKPFLYLSDKEKSWQPPWPRPWIVLNAGHKQDTPVKGIPYVVACQVVDWLRSQGVAVVQVGGKTEIHPRIPGCVDFIGKTTLRDLFTLVYHADFYISGITLTHHVAGAFGKKGICVCGGREPSWFVEYANSTMLSAIGKLDCCRSGGCWRWDFSKTDRGCVLPVVEGNKTSPQCMHVIGAGGIIEAAKHMLATTT